MPFPHRSRVVFDSNPLIEVVFQARFPRLLEIEQDLPVRFHMAIRDRFPGFNIAKMLGFSVDLLHPGVSSPVEARSYEMSSYDQQWKVVLTGEFLALSTTRYTTWAEFREKAKFVLDAFFQHYRPNWFLRIGLRYRDSISRKRFNLEDVPWKELLAPHVTGVFASDDLVNEEILGTRAAFGLKLRDDLLVQVIHGIIQTPNQEIEYLIDSDFYAERQTEASSNATIGILDGFRPFPNSLFLWCITDRLREAMGGREQSE